MQVPKIVVVGSSNTDLVAGAPKIPSPGETILGGEFSVEAGGKGANQAVAAARLGAEVTFVACVGTDDFGNRAVERFSAEGIDVTHVRRVNGIASGVALIVVAESGENSIVVAPGSNADLSVDDVDRAAAAIRDADVLVAQLEVPIPAVQRAFEIARNAGVTTVLNPAPAAPVPDDLLALVDFLTPNETEAAALAGMEVRTREDAVAAAKGLLERGVGAAVVTRGAEGALLVTPDAVVDISARKVAPVDTVAAGDGFNGAFAVALGRGDDVETALRYAGAAASIAVTRKGAQPSMPTAREVEEALGQTTR